MKKLTALLISLVLAPSICVAAAFNGFASDCDKLVDSTLRLHIIANSDSEVDQNLKLLVRDALTERFGALFSDVTSFPDAAALAAENLSAFEQTADAVLKKNGSACTAHACLVKCWFDTTDYGAFVLPAGNYRAIRLIIGNGEGHNWFCVAFPPLCIYAATEKDEKEAEKVLSQYGWKAAGKKGSYVIRFKLYEKLKKWFSDNS